MSTRMELMLEYIFHSQSQNKSYDFVCYYTFRTMLYFIIHITISIPVPKKNEHVS